MSAVSLMNKWWQVDSIDSATAASIDQSMLDHLRRHMTRVPVFIIIIAAVIATIASRSVPLIWPLLWFSLVVVLQLYRGRQVAKLAGDLSRPSSERLHDCVRLFFLTSAAFALSACFFPFAIEPFRCVLSMAVVGLIAGSLATLQGYPPIFFSFAIPNSLAISVGWLVSSPGLIPYWVHVVLAGLMMVLLGYLLVFSRDTYRTFAISQNTNTQLQHELKKAQRINDAKSKVFASASHDLRQPLQSISLLSHKLSEGNVADEERKSVAATIGVCVDLLSEELDMLLDISDLESDMSANNPELVDVGSVIDNLVDLYAPVAIAKDVALGVDKRDSPAVMADRVLLTRLMRNLIDNALKYTSEGSVRVTVRREGAQAFIDFEDTGVGISTEDQALIFDEFYQSGNPERDRSRGLGLGLSVVNRILPLVGGQLSVQSSVNEGSRFSLQLPASEQSIKQIQKPPAASKVTESRGQSGVLSGKRVLLIEDHELVQKATKALLESNGAEVLLALNWAETERLLEQVMPDLLVSDLRLPQESGLQIANQLRAVKPDLPVVLISGEMSSELATEAERVGYRVLGKPVNVATLLSAIESVIE